MIPKVIHFMWLDKKDPYKSGFPGRYAGNLQKWIELNPDARVVMWNYKDVEDHFPEYMDYIEKTPAWISKCDLARFLILQKYGGIYSDLDFIPLKKLDNSVWNRDILVIKEPEEHVNKSEGEKLFNGFVGAKPEHPFIQGWIRKIQHYIESADHWDVMNTTGPVSFNRYYQENPIAELDPYDACRFIPVVCPVENNPLKNFYVKPGCETVEPFCYTRWVDGTGWGISENDNKNYKYYIIPAVLMIFIIYIWRSRKSKKSRK